MVQITEDRNANEFNGKTFITTIVEAPDGVSFLINSSLTRDVIKTLLEELVLVK